LYNFLWNKSQVIQHPIQSVPGVFSPAVKRPGREGDHSPPSSAGVKKAWSYTFTPPVRLQGVVFNQAIDTCLKRGTYLNTGTNLLLLLFQATVKYVLRFCNVESSML